MPRPPQTLSRSTPSWRAAVRIGVPTGKAAALARGREDDEGILLNHDDVRSPIFLEKSQYVRKVFYEDFRSANDAHGPGRTDDTKSRSHSIM
jgi:ABC-type tungstate transport system permease subunit